MKLLNKMNINLNNLLNLSITDYFLVNFSSCGIFGVLMNNIKNIKFLFTATRENIHYSFK
jgi:hypothetical protein